MTGHSDSADSRPAGATDANWNWLSDRVQQTDTEVISQWLDERLLVLEADFESYVTANSRAREFRRSR